MADKPGYATDETEGHNIQQISEPPCHLHLPLQLLPENFKFQIQDDKKYINCKNKGNVLKIKEELHILYYYSTLMITFHRMWNSFWTELPLFQLSGERTWNTFSCKITSSFEIAAHKMPCHIRAMHLQQQW